MSYNPYGLPVRHTQQHVSLSDRQIQPGERPIASVTTAQVSYAPTIVQQSSFGYHQLPPTYSPYAGPPIQWGPWNNSAGPWNNSAGPQPMYPPGMY